MGRERTEKRKRFYVCIAGVILTLLSGCAPAKKPAAENPAEEHLRFGKELLSRKEFVSALAEFNTALSLAGLQPPGDEALYGIGLVYAHENSPLLDLAAAQNQFIRLVSDYPQSPLALEAEIWILLLKELQAFKAREQDLAADKSKVKPEVTRAETFVQRGQQLVAQGKFAEGLRFYERASALAPCEPPGDRALLDMALVFVHQNNPGRDYNKSLALFQKLIHDFPNSSLVPQATMWIDVLQTIEKARLVDIEIEERKKELNQ